MSLFYNVKGSSVSGGQATTELISPNVDRNVKSILLVNLHDTVAATVTLFIQNDPIDVKTSTYEILHSVSIPALATLAFEEPLIFSIPEEYGLYITVANNDLVDVIIKT